MDQNIQITVNDLALCKELFELASTRGAFKANELSTVGQVYDKLSAFITHVVKTQTENKPAGETSID